MSGYTDLFDKILIWNSSQLFSLVLEFQIFSEIEKTPSIGGGRFLSGTAHLHTLITHNEVHYSLNVKSEIWLYHVHRSHTFARLSARFQLFTTVSVTVSFLLISALCIINFQRVKFYSKGVTSLFRVNLWSLFQEVAWRFTERVKFTLSHAVKEWNFTL